MSKEALRAVALTEAVKSYGSAGASGANIVTTAKLFFDWLNGDDLDIKQPAKALEQPKAEAPKAVAKKEAKQIKEEPKAEGPTKEAVGLAIEKALKANKRKEIVALLAQYNGAASATSLHEQGPDVATAFLEQADELLLAA